MQVGITISRRQSYVPAGPGSYSLFVANLLLGSARQHSGIQLLLRHKNTIEWVVWLNLASIDRLL